MGHQSSHSPDLFDVQLFQDENVLKNLYEENYSAIVTYVVKNSGTEHDARDVYQEAFLAVWRNVQLQKFLPASKAEFSAYLYQVGRFKWIDQLRAKKLRPVSMAEPNSVAAEELNLLAKEDQERIEAVRKQFLHLGKNCRELLQRFYFLRQKLREIAESFAWTEATAKNNKYRCLQQLKQLLHEAGKK